MYEDNFKRTINGIEFEVFVKELERRQNEVEQALDAATNVWNE